MQQERWTSPWTFIFAAGGSAIGLGNIWRFPYIVGTHGGGAFVLAYLFFVVLLGVPLMMAETTVGRMGRLNPAIWHFIVRYIAPIGILILFIHLFFHYAT